MYAIGIDLAWSPRNPSGLAIAARERNRWTVREAIGGLRANEDILAYMNRTVGGDPAIVAIDAPLVVPWERRGREGVRLMTRLFGPMEAGVYPTTRRGLRRYGGNRIWELVAELGARGYRHDSNLVRRDTRHVFETYPHAATVALFELKRTLKYKARQGRTYATRWRALRALESLLLRLAQFNPPMDGIRRILERDVRGLRGGLFKDYEDRLDAILCAYVAAYYWTWGTRRCAVVGTLEGGYIVTPMTLAIARRAPPNSPVFAYDGGQSGGAGGSRDRG